jgi:predicted DsbA family dithiol-disulfide isomerase
MKQPARPEALQIAIVSDVVCPWCLVGYKQLERALEAAEGRFEASLRWHAFELNPQLPAEGENLREHLMRKAVITAEQSAQARERLTALGAELGFTFNFSDDMRISNTFRAHQLLHWAADTGRQTALKLALFEAYFTHGGDLHDPAVLLDAVARCGLPVAEAEAVLADGRFAAAVREDERRWQEQELRSVPTFIVDGRYAVMGAQGVDAFTRVLERAADARATA